MVGGTIIFIIVSLWVLFTAHSFGCRMYTAHFHVNAVNFVYKINGFFMGCMQHRLIFIAFKIGSESLGAEVSPKKK